MQLDAKTEAFWRAYLASLPGAEDAICRFYEVSRIGNSPEVADEGAALNCGRTRRPTSRCLKSAPSPSSQTAAATRYV